MAGPLRVLMLEDNEQDAELIAQELRKAGFELLLGRVDSEAGYLASLEQPFDLVLADYALPQYDALRALTALQGRGLDIPFIVVTGSFEEQAIACLKQGAADYLIKDRLGRLGPAVRQALEERALREQKRRADEVLRASEERYRSLFEDSRDPVMIIDRDGQVNEFNYTTLLLFGYTREEMLALHIQDMCVDPEEAAQLQRAIEQAGAVRNFEIRLLNKGGEEIECLVTASGRQGPGGSIVGFQGFFRDITEQKRAERELLESEARYRSIANSAVDAILVTDAKGTILYCNPATERIFRWGAEELLGLSVESLIPERNRGEFRMGLQSLDPGLKSDHLGAPIEVTGVRKTGDEFLIEMAVSGWAAADRSYFSAIIRDLTERRDAARQTQEQDRLAAVGQLAAGIAHDFNNILGIIVLYAELLRSNERLPAADLERIDTILRQAHRGAALIGQVLDFSGRSVMETHAIDLKAVLPEIVELLSRTLPESIRLSFGCEGEAFIVEADRTRIQQMVMNLALNARDAMPQGGNLSIRLSRIMLEPGQAPPAPGMGSGEWVLLQISDTGEGIPPEDVPHIFEPFFTTKLPGKGTGLGLAQVHGIVAQHNGVVLVDSHSGEGATFKVYLPAGGEEEAHDYQVDARQAFEKGQGETILLVEDDATARQAIGEILQALNYTVLYSGNGDEALQEYERHARDIDLVLTDMVMPEMGGAELYRALQARHPAVKVVLMTGYPAGRDTRELLDRRQVVWLQKPFTAEALSKSLRQGLDR